MYKHLSRKERYQIHSLLKAKQTITEIALSLGRSRSTISRELTDEELTMIEKIESPAQKAAGIQDTPRGVLRLVKPCCNSYLNPPIFNEI